MMSVQKDVKNRMEDVQKPASVAWMRVRLADQEVAGSIPPGRQHSFVEIDNEILSMVILSLPLIQEGRLSVSGERMECAQYWLNACPVNVWLGKLTALGMIPLG